MVAAHRVAVIATLLVMVGGAAADARRGPRLRGASIPTLLRLEGYVGAAPAGVKPDANLLLHYRGTDYAFALTQMVVITGSRSASEVLQEIMPYHVSFILRGSPPAIATLTSAPTGQKVIVVGYHRRGSRDLLVDSVTEPPPDPTPTAS